jgi:hypothetical protein
MLFPLGDRVVELCGEFDASGYGTPAHVVREAIEKRAGTDQRREQLWLYWTEYAKERLASLAGPTDILRGKLPRFAAYRSSFLDKLRRDRGQLKSSSPIVSPQIEPTMKSYVETLPDDPVFISLNDDVRRARDAAATRFRYPSDSSFDGLLAKHRYELLRLRYSSILKNAGFTLDSHRRSGLVYRKLTSNGSWAVLFVDDSRDLVEAGRLSVMMGVTLPRKAVLPQALPLCAVATFAPEHLIPGFSTVQGFSADSHAEFCLAADSCAHMALKLFEKLDIYLGHD